MPVKFLPRRLQNTNARIACHQLVDMYQYEGLNACPLCYYGAEVTDFPSLNVCALKHGCNHAKFLWAVLAPVNAAEIHNAKRPDAPTLPLYELAGVFRMVKYFGMPRYIQLVLCHGVGYKCNTMCFYFNQRMARKQTAEECAHVYGCGANGSFYNLTTPSDETINQEVYDQEHPHSADAAI